MVSFNDRIRKKITRNRISQRDMIPKAVKERQWLSGNLYNLNEIATFEDLLTLSNGEDDQITLTFTHDKGHYLIVPEPMCSLYVSSSVEDTDYELPGGGSITESQWIWTPFSWNYDQYKNSAGKAANKSVGKLYIRNVSAGASQAVTLVVQVKFQSALPASV